MAILLDLRLPEGGGLEVYRQLALRNMTAPTVVVSGFVTQESDAIRSLRDHGVSAVLDKPFPPTQLLSLLAAIPA